MISLSSILASGAGALGVPGYADRIGLGGPSAVVVVLVDGLGAVQAEAHAELLPAVSEGAWLRARSVIPSTTPTALASLGTGESPGQHGLVGASFWLPEEEEILSPLHWGSTPHPQAVQPDRTIFESAQASGLTCQTIASAKYAESGLTRAAFRGGAYLPADTDEDWEQVCRTSLQRSSTLSYVYWPELDRLGHEFGVASNEWLSGLTRVNAKLDTVRRNMHSDAVLLVTADHGMVNCHTRITWEHVNRLHWGVKYIGGEPRARHVYLHEGYEPLEVQAIWVSELGENFDVLTRVEVENVGLLGQVREENSGRVGDLMVFARGDAALVTESVDRKTSSLLGQHGSTSEAETEIPLIMVKGT
jgi:predicted AlkP superfamily pyrophosphatase or phosphodiesterase